MRSLMLANTNTFTDTPILAPLKPAKAPGRRLALAIPDATPASLPGCGYVVPEERPREPVAALEDVARRSPSCPL